MSEKSIKTNSILNVIKTISSILFPLITFPYISRVLQPENVGKVNFGTSYVNYFSLIASLGITTYAVRECSAVRNNKNKLGKIASEIFSINICTTIVAYTLLFCSLILFRNLDRYRTLIIIQSTVILFATFGADWLNTAMEDFKYITIRSIAFQVVSLILMFAFVRKSDDYIKYAIISVVSSSGANLANIFYRRKYCDVHFTQKMRWKVHFKPILLLFVMIMAQNIFNSVDITMLGLMRGDFEVGIYSTAHKIKNIIVQIVASLCWVVMPRMSLYFAEDNWIKINGMLKKVLSVMVTIGFPCIAGSIALSKEIVLIVGGTGYSSAALPLVILMASYVIDIFGGSFLGNMVCLPSKKENIYMEACCVAAIINVILNYLLIPIGGASAAALTSGLSAVVILVWLFVKRDRRVSLKYLPEICKAPLVGSILIIVVCFIVKKVISGLLAIVLVCVPLCVGIYAIVMVCMRNPMALMVLDGIKRKINR